MPALPSQRVLGHFALWAFIGYSCLFFLQQTNLVTSDLGRHVMNGRVATTAMRAGNWQEFSQLLTTNFYSYTEPDFPTQMHHWLFGVLAAGVEQTFGFAGLTWLNMTVVGTAFGVTLWVVSKQFGIRGALGAGLLVLPLLTSRTEVRPESFSLLFLALSFWLVQRAMEHKSSNLMLGLAALIIQALWVNMHIFFALGVGVFFLSWAEQWWQKRRIHPRLSILLIGSTLGSLCTPLGLAGVLAPFTLFGNYGYLIAENMSLWFMLERFGSPLYWYIATLFVVALLVLLVLHKKILRLQPAVLLFALLGILGTTMLNRFANVGALLLLPALGFVFARIPLHKFWQNLANNSTGLLVTSTLATGLAVAALATQLFIPQLANMGVGLRPDSLQAADFIRTQQLPGPIFNNYDIGSYLIYALPPDQNVFVDNRPEAYSTEFLQKILIAAQENEETWKTALNSYNFNSIVFYRHDQTPWAQPFLIRRVQDPDWVPVFVDQHTIILLRDISENTELIQRLQLPKSMFVTTPST